MEESVHPKILSLHCRTQLFSKFLVLEMTEHFKKLYLKLRYDKKKNGKKTEAFNQAILSIKFCLLMLELLTLTEAIYPPSTRLISA